MARAQSGIEGNLKVWRFRRGPDSESAPIGPNHAAAAKSAEPLQALRACEGFKFRMLSHC